MKRILTFVFPIYNWGQAAFLGFGVLLIALIAIFADPDLALHMGVAGYLGIVVSHAILGMAPDEMEIRAHEIAPIEALVATSRHLTRIGDRLWAPTRYRSRWWESDRISIVERPDGTYVLKARRRDLKIIREGLGR